MKLAAIYLVFNALEHLEGSINQIYDHSDIIMIGWQKTSHYGDPSTIVEPFVNAIKDKYPKVVLFEHKERAGDPKKQERDKINTLLKQSLIHGCTHFFISATDHYYDPSQFAKCKEIAKDYQVTASKMWTYFKEPKWRLKEPEGYYMPFICQLTPQTYTKNTRGVWNVHVDPALCFYPNDTFYEFSESELMMHHYSFVRLNLANKLRNAAARRNFNNRIPEILQKTKEFNGVGKCPYFNQEVVEVPNYFGISL